MQCPKCHKDFSDAVIDLHLERCDEVNEESVPAVDPDLAELREKAKELGIENADRKGEKRLREEIEAATAAKDGGGNGG